VQYLIVIFSPGFRNAGLAGGCKPSLSQPSTDRFVVKLEVGVRDADRGSCEQECWKGSLGSRGVTRHNPTRDQGIACDVERIGQISEERRYSTSNTYIFPFLFLVESGSAIQLLHSDRIANGIR
jgi:hypothetical protein